MYSLDESFKKLYDTLELNRTAVNKDFWTIYFHWWRYFYCFNENLQLITKENDRLALTGKFMQYNKELVDLGDRILEQKKMKNKKFPAIEAVDFPEHVQNMIQLMKKEQDRSAKLVKEMKKQKRGKYPKKIGGKMDKWLKS